MRSYPIRYGEDLIRFGICIVVEFEFNDKTKNLIY